MTESTTEPINEIRADRACIGCGFNLYGQSVTKEEHYGLAIARCPECGVVAALQNYPAMSHWVNRFRSIIAAAWIVILLGVFAGYIVTLVGLTHGASNLAGGTMAGYIGQAHQQWSEEQVRLQSQANQAGQTNAAITISGLPAGATIVATNGVTTINGVAVTPATPAAQVVQATPLPAQFIWTWLESSWIDDHLDQVIENHGGLWRVVDREFLVMFIPGTIVSILFGIFWSVTLLGGSRRKVAIVPAASFLFASLILIGFSVPDKNFVYASNLSQSLYVPIVGPLYLAGLLFVAILSVWIGRRVARWVIVLALPPRSRVSLSLLWTCDGLALPRPK